MQVTTTSEALEFLRKHQPMPSDYDISNEEADTYVAVLQHLEENPSAESIPLLIGSLGDGCGLGMYQHVRLVLMKLPRELVARHLRTALENPGKNSRTWCAELAMAFPDPVLVPPMLDLLVDEDQELRWWAAATLEFIGDPATLPKLEEAMAREVDPAVRDQMMTAISTLTAKA
jgi:hypothetical protein